MAQPQPAPDPASTTPERRGRRSRGLVLIGCAALGLGLLAVAWITVTALLARSHLDRVRAELPELRAALASGNLDATRTLAADIRANAARAHELTSGPAWWTAANLPVVGAPLNTGRTIAAQADVVGQQVLPGVVRLAGQVGDLSHLSDSTIDLDRVAAMAPSLQSAAAAADSAALRVRRSDPSWLGPVSSARGQVLDALDQIDGELTGAARAVRIAVPMLGESGQKRYMIGFLNEAEARGLGGIPGAFAIATVDHGKITFTHFGSDEELYGVSGNVDLGADFAARYGQNDPTGYFQNSDLSPDFTDAARIWAGMWQRKTGEHLDGALAIDPTALSYLLKVTGPVELPGRTKVSASNVVALTQQTQYGMYGTYDSTDKAARKQFLADMAAAVAKRLTRGADGAGTVRALSRAAQQRRLLVWSADPAVQRQIAVSGWGGVLDGHGRPFSGFSVSNAAGSKLDYYLQRSMSYRREGCGAGSTVVATLKLTNTAPTSGLPPYVTVRFDDRAAHARPGDNRLLVSYFGTAGASVQSVRLDGKPLILGSGTENGLVTVTTDLELPAGATRTLTITTREPAANGPVQFLRQPLARPMDIATDGRSCG